MLSGVLPRRFCTFPSVRRSRVVIAWCSGRSRLRTWLTSRPPAMDGRATRNGKRFTDGCSEACSPAGTPEQDEYARDVGPRSRRPGAAAAGARAVLAPVHGAVVGGYLGVADGAGVRTHVGHARALRAGGAA